MHEPPRRSATLVTLLFALAWCGRASAQDSVEPAQPPSGPSLETSPANPSPPAAPDVSGAAAEESPVPASLPAAQDKQPQPEVPAVPPVPPPAVPLPKATPPRPDEVFSGRPARREKGEHEEEHSWFDAGHAFVGRVFFTPVVKLDKFFGDRSELEPEATGSYARLRGGLLLREGRGARFSADLQAQLHLPGIQRWLDRFRLVFSGASNTEGELTPESQTAAPLAFRRFDPANLELRFGAYRGIRTSLDLGAGLLFRVPPGAFVRARYRLAAPIDDLLVATLSTQVYYRTDLLLGTRTDAALEWPVTQSSLVRLAGTAQVAMRHTRGLEYGAQFAYLLALSPTAAVAVGTDASGATRDNAPVFFDKYRIYTRFRHDVLRRWLFVEVEPEVGWPWEEGRGRHRELAATFWLEVQIDEAPVGR